MAAASPAVRPPAVAFALTAGPAAAWGCRPLPATPGPCGVLVVVRGGWHATCERLGRPAAKQQRRRRASPTTPMGVGDGASFSPSASSSLGSAEPPSGACGATAGHDAVDASPSAASAAVHAVASSPPAHTAAIPPRRFPSIPPRCLLAPPPRRKSPAPPPKRSPSPSRLGPNRPAQSSYSPSPRSSSSSRSTSAHHSSSSTPRSLSTPRSHAKPRSLTNARSHSSSRTSQAPSLRSQTSSRSHSPSRSAGTPRNRHLAARPPRTAARPPSPLTTANPAPVAGGLDAARSTHPPPTSPTPAATPVAADAEVWRFPPPRRVVAIGDIHGTVSALRSALRIAGLLHPSRDEWVGGDAVLVQTGDLLDRGDTEVAVIRLLMHLQSTAGTAGGGAVHLLLGNHEEDAVNRPAHVVRPSTCAAWDAAYPHLSGHRVGGIAATMHRQRCIPAGTGWTAQPYQLARHRAMAPGGPMAVALAPRLKVVVVIGDTLFVHGSLTAAMLREQLAREGTAGSDVSGDAATRDFDLDAPTADALVTSMNTRLRRHLAGELTYPPGASQWERLEAFPAVTDRTFSSPLWCGDRGEADDLAAVLRLFRVRRMVVGHTIHGRVTARYGGRVWCIDTGMFRKRGRVEVLEICAPGHVSVLSAEGRRRGMTVAEGGETVPVYVGDGYEAEFGELYGDV